MTCQYRRAVRPEARAKRGALFSTAWHVGPAFPAATFLVRQQLKRAFLRQSDVCEARETKDSGFYPSAGLAVRQRAFAMLFDRALPLDGG
jgi:hypothetical protein